MRHSTLVLISFVLWGVALLVVGVYGQALAVAKQKQREQLPQPPREHEPQQERKP